MCLIISYHNFITMKNASSIFLLLFIALASRSQTIPFNQTPDWESTPNGHIATGLGLADIDGDGWKDIIAANGNDINRQHLVVYYNNGDGTFPLNPGWESDDIDYHGHLATGDINKDGWIDIAVSVYLGEGGFNDPGKVKVYYNLGGELEGTPTFVSEPFYTFSCALGDADADGDLDLAVAAGEPYGGIYDEGKVFLNRNGYFSPTPDWESDNQIGAMDVDFGDFDGNGFLDLAFVCEETPNFIYLADNEGNISTQPAWQSSESPNYINSLDIGVTGNNVFPSLVMTGNDQLGGDGKVRLYTFETGVPLSSPASWTSNPFGYGSGILLAEINGDSYTDLIYGGWWLPVNIALGDAAGFEMNPSYTSSTTSVVEAILMSDLDRDDILIATETITIDTDGISAIYLEEQIVEQLLSVQINGLPVSQSFYCWVPGKSWVSFKDGLRSTDVVVAKYEYSDDNDMVITNWDGSKGNYIFYNDPTIPGTKEIAVSPGISLKVRPNPSGRIFYAEYTIRDPGLVKLVVSDINGNEIYVSEMAHPSAGSFSKTITLRENTSAGTYFVTAASGSAVGHCKLVVR